MCHGQILLVLLFIACQTQAILHSPPKIIKQPPNGELLYQVADRARENDKPFSIECEAEGVPSPKYSWTKNGQIFDWWLYDDRMVQRAGYGTIMITTPLDEDVGDYQCFAENEYGIATSNLVRLRKAELGNFMGEFVRTVTANEGEPFTLQCKPPSGWPKPAVFWLFQSTDGGLRSINSSRITLDPDGNLHFAYVTSSDASHDFYYVCAATSRFRNEFKMGNPPTLQYGTLDSEESVLRGSKAELHCIFGGRPLPQTIWKKNYEIIHWSDRITQENYGKMLMIHNTTFDDSGSYTCEVSNGVGLVQMRTIHLRVEAVPYFTVEPVSRNASEDDDVEFKFEAAGEPKPVIEWIRNGKPIDLSPNNPQLRVSDNSIHIGRVKLNDTGNYGCKATNGLGYVYKDVHLNVLSLQPEIVEPPRNTAILDGRDVTLRCRASGFPAPEVKWIRNGLELNGERYQTQLNGDLVIRNASFDDAKQYSCHARNKLGEAKADVILTVKEHTRIIDEPQHYEVALGSPAHLLCTDVADSSLGLHVKWFGNGEEIDFDEPRFVQTSDNTLTISSTAELDFVAKYFFF